MTELKILGELTLYLNALKIENSMNNSVLHHKSKQHIFNLLFILTCFNILT